MSDRRNRRVWLMAGLAVLLGSLGCSDEGDDCDLLGAPQGPMFTITVVDSVTGEPAWWRATAMIEDGAFAEALISSSVDPADSASSQVIFSTSLREGVYKVTVDRPGYQRWVRSGLTVRDEGCYMTTHGIEARLQALP